MKPRSISTILWAAIPTVTMALVYPPDKPTTPMGCYAASDPLIEQGDYQFQSEGWCQETCWNITMPVAGTTSGSNCYCGNGLPADSAKVSDDKCNTICNGYGTRFCGGKGYWTVFLSGVDDDVSTYKNGTSAGKASASPTKTGSPSVVTVGGQTVVVTATKPPAASKGSGSNKAGIAAGVVVGLVLLTAIITGAYVFIRARRRRAVEEEFRRNAAISSFTQKPESTSSISDSRLEPSVMMQRRMSDGSIADNQDYSRRILKVTNPDGS